MRKKGLIKPFHTFTCFGTILILLSSCIAKNDVAIKLKNPKKKETFTSLPPVTVSNVQVVNHQIIITGTNLASVSQFQVKDGSTNTSLQIESKNETTIVANALSNVTFAAGKILDFIFTNAEAAATFTVNFSLCDSTLGGKAFNCTLTPNDKEVLSYDAASGKWQPRAVNGLSYIGTFDASGGGNPSAKPAGNYYIVSVAGDIDGGATILGVGDWIVSNGTSWQKIDNSTAITSVHGRTGAVVGAEGDYSLPQLSDVTITAPIPNQILKYNGTTWVNSDLSALGGGTVTSVSAVAPISVTNGTSTPTISISQANGSTNGYLTSSDWNTFNNKQPTITTGTTAQYYRGDKTWQTLDTLAVPENTNLYFTNARALGVPLTGFATNTTAIAATDTILQAFGKAQGQIDNLVSGGSNYIVKNGIDTVTGVVNFNTVGALSIGYTPTNMTDATSKSYVDSTVSTAAALKVNKAGDTMTGALAFRDSGSNTVSLQAPTTIGTSYVLKLPSGLGANNQVLTTDASGNLSWSTPASSLAPNGGAGGDLSGSYPNPTITALNATKVGGGAVDNTEFSYLDGVTSSIQTQLNSKLSSYTETDPGVSPFAKAALPTCNAGEVLKANGTSFSCVTDNVGAGAYTGTQNRLVLTDGSTGALTTSTVTNVEAGYLSGVSSNIQTQLNAKQATISKTTDQDVRSLRIFGTNTTNYVELTTGTLTGNRVLSFPDSNGSNGNVLSTNGSGTLSWVAIPSAPVTSVHGRTSAVVSVDGDYTASQITNVAAGNIVATNVQAAITELDNEKQNVSTFAADVKAVLLTGISTATSAVIDATDSVLSAFGKLQAQISENITNLSNKADRTNVTQTITALAVTGLSSPSVGADATNKTYVDAQIAGAANQWTLSGGNVYRNSGNVGIGTTNPTSNLHMVINDTGSIRIQDSLATGSQLVIGEGTGTANLFSPTFLGTSVGSARYTQFIGEAKVAEDTGAIPVVAFSARRDDSAAIINRPLFDWRNASTSLMTMLASGNVGIGTTSPNARLQVGNDFGNTSGKGATSVISDLQPKLYMNGTDMAAGLKNASIIFGAGGVDKAQLDVNINNGNSDLIWSVAGAEKFRIVGTTGKVGIGTSDPKETFDIKSGHVFHTGGDLVHYLNGYYDSTVPSVKHNGYGGGSKYSGAIGYSPTTGLLYLSNTATTGTAGANAAIVERFAITKDGDVGVGTSTPTAKLEVNGTIKGNIPSASNYSESPQSTTVRSTWINGLSVTVPAAGSYNITGQARMLCLGTNDNWWKSRIYNQTQGVNYITSIHTAAAFTANVCKGDGTIPLNRIVSGLNAGDVLVLQFYINGTDTTAVSLIGNSDGGSSINIVRVSN